VIYRANFTININANERAALVATEPRALRINSNLGNLDVRLSEDDRGAFQNNIRCISGGAQ
jgi:hypothetical protein